MLHHYYNNVIIFARVLEKVNAMYKQSSNFTIAMLLLTLFKSKPFNNRISYEYKSAEQPCMQIIISVVVWSYAEHLCQVACDAYYHNVIMATN